MLQSRGLLIATVTLAALSGYLWWSNRNPAAPDAVADSKREQLVTLQQADLVEVTVARKGEAPLVLKKNPAGNNWEMVLDPSLPTSAKDAMDVVTNAATISSSQMVEENATDLIQFGLEPANVTVTLKDQAGKTQQLLIGDESPVGNKFYARRPNEKKVYAIDQYFKVGLDKTVNDLRDKRLLILDETKLARIEVSRAGEVLEFGKSGQGLWQLLKPQPYRTDATVVDDFLNKLREASFDPALPAAEAKQFATSFASASPVGAVTVSDAGGAKRLEIRKTVAGDYLGRSTSVEGIYKLDPNLGEALGKPLEDYRSKKLMDFGYEDPKRVEVVSGGKTSVLEKKGEDWIWNGKKADSATVVSFLEQLRGFSALGFVAKGFTEPVFSVTLTQNDGKTVEKLRVSKSGNFHYAKRDGEVGEYEIDPKTLADLEAEIGKIKEAGAAKK